MLICFVRMTFLIQKGLIWMYYHFRGLGPPAPVGNVVGGSWRVTARLRSWGSWLQGISGQSFMSKMVSDGWTESVAHWTVEFQVPPEGRGQTCFDVPWGRSKGLFVTGVRLCSLPNLFQLGQTKSLLIWRTKAEQGSLMILLKGHSDAIKLV